MFTSGWTVPLKLSSFLSKYKLSIRSRTSHFHVKWDVKPQMWVTSLRVPRRERWHLIPEPVQPRVIYSGLSTAAIHVITSQGFSVLQVLQLLCHPGLLPDAHRAVMSAVSSDHRPPLTLPLSFCLAASSHFTYLPLRVISTSPKKIPELLSRFLSSLHQPSAAGVYPRFMQDLGLVCQNEHSATETSP